eukprot:COSAG02_NODE_12415_length_1549_cov_2.064828_1_plen_229_part_00
MSPAMKAKATASGTRIIATAAHSTAQPARRVRTHTRIQPRSLITSRRPHRNNAVCAAYCHMPSVGTASLELHCRWALVRVVVHTHWSQRVRPGRTAPSWAARLPPRAPSHRRCRCAPLATYTEPRHHRRGKSVCANDWKRVDPACLRSQPFPGSLIQCGFGVVAAASRHIHGADKQQYRRINRSAKTKQADSPEEVSQRHFEAPPTPAQKQTHTPQNTSIQDALHADM